MPGLVLLANGNVRIFFVKEVVLNLWLLGISALLMTGHLGVESIGVAFLTMYCLNLSFLVYYVPKKYGFSLTKASFFLAIFGLVVVLVTSATNWDLLAVDIRQTAITLARRFSSPFWDT